MRYVMISDIHANLEALEAARVEIKRISPDRVLCLGDIVGYGASPVECIEAVKQLAGVTVAGNHDFGVAGRTNIRYFNSYARHAVLWTVGALEPEHLAYLGSLPLTHVEDGRFRIVHATPSDPAIWDYIFSREQALREFGAFPEQICFVGHSHQAGIFRMDEDGGVERDVSTIEVVAGRKYIINVGSVGQPRDGDSRACLCTYDSDTGGVAMVRVDYDVKAAQKRIISAGLPAVLANRLAYGE
ncbi:MAG: metallophosphoesterase family protein [Candidatus Eisenbacteria bacterium]